MKTLGRILIILAVFALLMGITYVSVNARNSSAPGTTDRFQPGSAGSPWRMVPLRDSKMAGSFPFP